MQVKKKSTSPLGCLRDATAAVERQLSLVGSGGYRTVYEDSRGEFVYKVAGRYGDGANVDEHRASEDARSKGVRGIPRTYLWDVGGEKVLCMRKYVAPDMTTARKVRETKTYQSWRDAGFADLHDWNYTVTRGGRPRLIDMQMYYPG